MRNAPLRLLASSALPRAGIEPWLFPPRYWWELVRHQPALAGEVRAVRQEPGDDGELLGEQHAGVRYGERAGPHLGNRGRGRPEPSHDVPGSRSVHFWRFSSRRARREGESCSRLVDLEEVFR